MTGEEARTETKKLRAHHAQTRQILQVCLQVCLAKTVGRRIGCWFDRSGSRHKDKEQASSRVTKYLRYVKPSARVPCPACTSPCTLRTGTLVSHAWLSVPKFGTSRPNPGFGISTLGPNERLLSPTSRPAPLGRPLLSWQKHEPAPMGNFLMALLDSPAHSLPREPTAITANMAIGARYMGDPVFRSKNCAASP